MKSNTFNHTLLAVGVAAALGVSSTAMAAPTSSGAVTNDGVDPIKNIATAVYSVGTGADAVKQPQVQSNEVIVNITETANFSLVATSDGTDDDKNIDIAATPGATSLFKHTLANNGNVTDTYTIAATGANSAIVTQNPEYALSNVSNISYSIDISKLSATEKAELLALNSGMSSDGNTATGTIVSNGTGSITLLPGLSAELSYTDTTPQTQLAGQFGVGTLSATSTYIATAKPGSEILINENQTVVKLPIFKIEKSATCGATVSCTSLDLNLANPTIDYSIKVTNVTTDYSVAADNFVVRDVLPAGMTLVEDATFTLNGITLTSSNYTTKMVAGRQVIDIKVASLAIGDAAALTIKFKVNVDKTVLRDAGTATNHAAVYDNYDDTLVNPDGTVDSVDSTDPAKDSNNVTDTDENGIGKDTPSKITFTDRKLSITANDPKEVAVKGEVTYTHTITNDGNEQEGNSTDADGVKRPIQITITDPTAKTDGTEPLTVTDVYYTTDNGVTKTPLVLVSAADGTYKLPDDVIIEPDASVEIGYTVKSTGKSEGPVVGNTDAVVADGQINHINRFEENQVTLTPGGDFATTIPPIAPVTNKTTIRGLKLVKLAAVDYKCTGTLDTVYADGSTTINAAPLDCISYKITATNTFTDNTAITALTLSDVTKQWKAQATYQPATASSPSGTAPVITGTGDDEAIVTTITTLGGGASADLIFSIRVNP